MAEIVLAEELRTAANMLRGMIDAARADLTRSSYYGHDEANYTQGINNACGGEAAELAASYTPRLADITVEWLEGCADDVEAATKVARQWRGSTATVDDVLGWCDETDSVRRALAYARLLNGAS
ncbi:hypothetical protein [Actinomadura bangladeshensis]|uniref:Uncharacterized protein n=1 Tax=Actinomadura bangladeshensis TaxID=453573 RepID=A0A6L9QB74_9ACTN|nr:hypothetical protein [Actinomadura bangladeshensis]NEA22651.1 hypothetical protein [Actinomadura bangladeshensis]